MNLKQNIEYIKAILRDCRFSDPADRKYWEDKLREMETRAKTAEENDKYFRTMKKYDRL